MKIDRGLDHQAVARRSKIRQANGTVMLELLVTTFLVGSVAISIFLALAYGYKITVAVNREQLVGQIAASEMEKIRTNGFANLTVPYNGPLLSNPPRLNLLPNAEASTQINLYLNNPALKEITVTVSWTEQGKNGSKSFTTLVSEQGLSS